jgi:hypothetical protein
MVYRTELPSWVKLGYRGLPAVWQLIARYRTSELIIGPPAKARSGTPVKGRWGGVNISTSRSRGRDEIEIEKNYRSTTPTPRDGEERDSDQRTIGVGLELTAAEETGLRLRTMGG